MSPDDEPAVPEGCDAGQLLRGPDPARCLSGDPPGCCAETRGRAHFADIGARKSA